MPIAAGFAVVLLTIIGSGFWFAGGDAGQGQGRPLMARPNAGESKEKGASDKSREQVDPTRQGAADFARLLGEARACRTFEQRRQGLAAINAALTLFPDNAEAVTERARLSAIEDPTVVAERQRRERFEGLMSTARACTSAAELEQGLSAVREALTLFPDNAEALAQHERLEREKAARGPESLDTALHVGTSIKTAQVQLSNGDVVEARNTLNAFLAEHPEEAAADEARALMTSIAERTIFGGDLVERDPLVARYTLQPGDSLVSVAKVYTVPPKFLMRLNGITDVRFLRAGQSIRVVRGPFHAKICKSQSRLDVFLQDSYACSYSIAVSASPGLPTGVWRVKECLRNPTYYPPTSDSGGIL